MTALNSLTVEVCKQSRLARRDRRLARATIEKAMVILPETCSDATAEVYTPLIVKQLRQDRDAGILVVGFFGTILFEIIIGVIVALVVRLIMREGSKAALNRYAARGLV